MFIPSAPTPFKPPLGAMWLEGFYSAFVRLFFPCLLAETEAGVCMHLQCYEQRLFLEVML